MSRLKPLRGERTSDILMISWHTSAELVVPADTAMIPLPPKCPKLNPQENVWQYLRDNSLSNRIFTS